MPHEALCPAGYRDQVDEGHGIVADAPQGHEAHDVHQDHDDAEEVEEARTQVHAQQQAADGEGGHQAEAQHKQPLRYHRQVLLVEHVGDPAGHRAVTRGRAARARATPTRARLPCLTCRGRPRRQGQCPARPAVAQ